MVKWLRSFPYVFLNCKLIHLLAWTPSPVPSFLSLTYSPVNKFNSRMFALLPNYFPSLELKEGNLTALPSERKEARDKQIHSDWQSSLFYSEIRETKEGNKRKLAWQGEWTRMNRRRLSSSSLWERVPSGSEELHLLLQLNQRKRFQIESLILLSTLVTVKEGKGESIH